MDHKLCVNLNWAKLIGFSVLVIISIVHSVEVRPVSNEIKYICKCVSEEKPPFLCLLPPLGSSGSGTSAASYGGSCWGRQMSCPGGDCWCKRDCITHVCDGYCCFCKGLIDASGSTFIWMLVWQQPESKQVTTPNITILLMPRRLVEALSLLREASPSRFISLLFITWFVKFSRAGRSANNPFSLILRQTVLYTVTATTTTKPIEVGDTAKISLTSAVAPWHPQELQRVG